MAYAPRRRAGKEVQAFATAFMQGMKLFSDDDRRSGRSRDPYSDENLAKADERLGSTSALGKFFGMGKDELTGIDRGIAANNAKLDIAIARGDAPRIKQYTEEGIYLRRLRGDDGGGSKPAGAIPSVGAKDAGEKPQPLAPPPELRESPPAVGAPSFGVSPLESNQPLVPVPGTGINSPVRQSSLEEESSLFKDNQGETLASIDPTENVTESLFSARGGVVPALYAARGMSVPSRTGDTYQYGYVEDPNDAGFGATAIPESAPSAPTDGPAVETDENVANLGLSRDPEELAAAAVPAVEAGLNRIQAELTPSGAIPAQDPAYQEKLQKFARGQGRMSDEEIRQLDAIIDPDGKLPDASKSAARLAAIYKFYEDRGDPETASTAAARVILYNKFAAQTRGAMALQAINDGDLESGVRLLADAQNKDNPDGKTARGSVNPDGTVNFELGWDKLTGFEKTEGGRATKQDMVQMAQLVSSGERTMSDLMNMKRAGEGKGGGTNAVATKQQTGQASQDAINQYRKVDAILRSLPSDASPEDKQAVLSAAQAAYDRVRATYPIAKGKSLDYALNNQGIKPPQLPGASPAKPTSVEERKAAAEASEMDALYRERVGIEGGALAARGTAAGGVDVRSRVPVTEATAAEIARRSYGPKTPGYYPADAGTGALSDVQRTENLARAAGVGYSRAPDAPMDSGSKASIDKLAEPYLTALEGEEDERGKRTGGILNRQAQDAEGRVDPNAPVKKLTSSERQQFTDIFGRLAQKNKSLSTGSVAELAADIAFPRAKQIMNGIRPEIDWRTKEIVYNGKRMFVDEASIRDLAAMRGKAINEYFAAEKQAAGESRAKPVRALETKLKGIEGEISSLSSPAAYKSAGTNQSRQAARIASIKSLEEKARDLRTELEGYGSEYVSSLAKKKK